MEKKKNRPYGRLLVLIATMGTALIGLGFGAGSSSTVSTSINAQPVINTCSLNPQQASLSFGAVAWGQTSNAISLGVNSIYVNNPTYTTVSSNIWASDISYTYLSNTISGIDHYSPTGTGNWNGLTNSLINTGIVVQPNSYNTIWFEAVLPAGLGTGIYSGAITIASSC